ncbi:MAG: hypothetical protein M1827_006222 [Pycnora praestabilis]|nr:MAG: hypothetical protein M1827_006222 [Pycnora praestabilis]
MGGEAYILIPTEQCASTAVPTKKLVGLRLLDKLGITFVYWKSTRSRPDTDTVHRLVPHFLDVYYVFNEVRALSNATSDIQFSRIASGFWSAFALYGSPHLEASGWLSVLSLSHSSNPNDDLSIHVLGGPQAGLTELSRADVAALLGDEKLVTRCAS